MFLRQNSGPLRSSGHKQATEEHATAAKIATQGDDGDPEALLQNRILNNTHVSRAALYDTSDFLCIASSKSRFNLEPDHVRKILDGLLTYSRVGDPTVAGGAGDPPRKLHLGEEGQANVIDGDEDHIVGDLSGNTLIAARTATLVVLVEGKGEADRTSLETTVASFQEGLQALAL
ncbi:MAG: hypothetical protein TREMPRED_003869 [Tremellales sp. Tagirdzhanova-0007]|nr:MAG: hypothetical protein TREMPRED_003869 [Tremellales sp. Tagirdzhanova-0007]